MKHFGWVAGLGVAGLLVAGIPAQAQSGSTTGSQSTEDQMKGSGSTTSQGTGSAGSSTMGSGSATGSSTGMESSKNELTGTVQKFDRETKELTLANSDKTLKVSESTTVMKDGQAGTLSDIKEGEQVRASFSGSGDTLQVSQIEVMTAGSTGTSGMGTGSTGTTTPPSDTGTGSTGTTTTPPSDTGTGSTGTTTTPPSDTGTTHDSGSSGATPPPSKGY
ncbi:conserved hypothetical protein [Anaeromyxobacter sp. Fw109-5]|nr:conserved hypothetical protein [Anaeromyxobacter sp. Fw109-5]